MAGLTRRGMIGAGLGAALLAGCGRKAAGGAAAPLRVATYKGQIDSFFDAAGQGGSPFPLTRAFFAGGNQIVEAINAGAIDVGGMSEIPPIFVAGRDVPLRIIAVQHYDVNNQYVLVPHGSAIRGPADLRGKRIGYVRATTSHYILLRLLDEAGLHFSDITPVALSPQDGLTAFGQGRLDAWVIYGVQGSLARANGARVLTNGKGRLSGNYVLAASAEALADERRRAAIVDYVGRIARTWAWSVREPEKWAALLQQQTGVPVAITLQQFRERSTDPRILPVSDAAIASQQDVADRFARAGLLPAKVEVRPLWTTQLNQDIAGLQHL